MSHPKCRRNHLRIADTDDGGLAIYDETCDDGHIMNVTAAAVYKLADGTRSIDTLTEQVAARTGAPAEQDLVLLALDELDRVGLLDTDDTPARPAIHRRRFLAKLGLVAGAAALVPLIDTITRVSQAQPWQAAPPQSTPGPGAEVAEGNIAFAGLVPTTTGF